MTSSQTRPESDLLRPPWGFVLLLVIGIPLGLGLVYELLLKEAYFFPNPAIDTTFAPGYSEAKFAAIQPGMTQAEVLVHLGKPLDSAKTADGVEWVYSQDGALAWGDMAWLGRYVQFNAAGQVLRTEKTVYHD